MFVIHSILIKYKSENANRIKVDARNGNSCLCYMERVYERSQTKHFFHNPPIRNFHSELQRKDCLYTQIRKFVGRKKKGQSQNWLGTFTKLNTN